MVSRQEFVSAAISYLGCKESDGSHKKIIDLYNTIKPLPRGYKMKYTDAWCAAFVSAIVQKCGLNSIIACECSCSKMISGMQKLNSWVEDDAYVPQAGDLIFYNWDDTGKGDCSSGASHVGIVVSVSGNNIKVIEGNYSNSVKYRTIAVNAKYIRGFGVPKFKVEPKPVSDWPKSHTVKSGDTLSKIAKNYYGNSSSKYYNFIAKANNISNPNIIRVGTVLTIPEFKEESTKYELLDVVKMRPEVKKWASGTSMASWVKSSLLFVRKINGNKITVSIYSSGAITGTCYDTDLTLVSKHK